MAVDHLSFNMFKGQITSLLGHNGAGKELFRENCFVPSLLSR